MAPERGTSALHPRTTSLSPADPPPDGRSAGPRPLPRYSPERGRRGEGGRGEPRPPAHLPGLRTPRLRWRAGRHCPRPRKPPAPPAAAEASQRLRIATAAAAAAAAAVAALLPRGSRSAPASAGAGPTARPGRGARRSPRLRCVAPKWKDRSPYIRIGSLSPKSGSRVEGDTAAQGKGEGGGGWAAAPPPCGLQNGRARPAPRARCVCICMCTVCKRPEGGTAPGDRDCGRGSGPAARGCVRGRTWQPRLHVLASSPRVGALTAALARLAASKKELCKNPEMKSEQEAVAGCAACRPPTPR